MGFIQDIGFAATDWGVPLSNSYVLSLGASVLSALGRAVYVYACFTQILDRRLHRPGPSWLG
jgi:hypothetical protein